MKISYKKLREIIAEEVNITIGRRRPAKRHMSLVSLLSEDDSLPDEQAMEKIVSDNIVDAFGEKGHAAAHDIASVISDIIMPHLRVALTTGDPGAVVQALSLGREEAINQIGIDKLQGMLSVSDALRVVTAIDDIETQVAANFGYVDSTSVVDSDESGEIGLAEAIGEDMPSLDDVASTVSDIENLEKSSIDVDERLETLSAGLSTLMKKMKDLSQSVKANDITSDIEDIKAAIGGEKAPV